MAEEKKPKIDLKARLGKAGAATPPPPGAVPVPTPAPGAVAPPPAAVAKAAGIPVPPGVPVGPPPPAISSSGAAAAVDPSNPLAAVAAPYRAPTPPAPPQPQRIEVDEMAVQQARRGAFRGGLIAGIVVAVILGAVGYVAGGATEKNSARSKAVSDAKELAGDVTKAKDQMKAMADKVEAGRRQLLAQDPKERKFPDTLAKDLGGMNIDFDGSKLAGRRFSGFSTTATAQLVEFITAVQGLNDRRTAVINLLSKLQKPITEQYAASASGKVTVSHVVVLGQKDQAGNLFGILEPLKDPIVGAPGKVDAPKEWVFLDTLQGRQPSKVDKYTSGELNKPSAIYILPKSFEGACPSEAASAAVQLGAQLAGVLKDIRGEQTGGDPGLVQDTKPGLLERADRLVNELNKVN
jgi:outer membrane murein-binding lipoprotein Lpp